MKRLSIGADAVTMNEPIATKVPAGRYVSVKQYADYFRLSTQSVYAALRAGRLRGIRIGSIWLIPVEVRNRDAAGHADESAASQRDGSESLCHSIAST